MDDGRGKREERGIHTSSTSSLTRSRIGSGSAVEDEVEADGGKCRSSFWRESETVLLWR